MNPIARLIRGDETRKTRFHTSNGYLCLDPREFLRALVTTIARLSLHKYSHFPWLVYSATFNIAPLVFDKRIFEFGSGMSTLWFAQRCAELISVESNSEWYASVVSHTKGNNKVRVIYAESRADYLDAITQVEGKIDIVLIDGLYRKECVELSRSYLSPHGIVIVDNTDADDELSKTVTRIFGDSEIRAFRGWAPGILHPNETTVIRNIPVLTQTVRRI